MLRAFQQRTALFQKHNTIAGEMPSQVCFQKPSGDVLQFIHDPAVIGNASFISYLKISMYEGLITTIIR